MSDSVIIAFIAAVPGTIAATAAAVLGLLNHRKISAVEIQIDGRLTELLDLTAKASRAEGKLDK